MIRAKLLAIERVASVGTKGDILRRVMQSPFMIPIPEAPRRLIRIARGTGQPCVRRKATMTAVIPQTEPTDKSMPPVRMTKVIPMATIPTKEKFRVMFVMFWISRNCGIKTARTRSINPSAHRIPISRGSRKVL
jgi:hypothetical protein